MDSLNIKSNWKNITLESLIKKIDPSQDLSRTAVFEREVQAAQETDWIQTQLSLVELKREGGVPLSTSFQVKLSADTAKILEQVKSDMIHQLSLKRLKLNYMVLLLQQNYLNQLESQYQSYLLEKNVCKEKKVTGINMPAMAQILVEMMLIDHQCIELEKISTILVEWKQNQLESRNYVAHSHSEELCEEKSNY